MDIAKTGNGRQDKKSAGTSEVTFDDSPYTLLLQFGPDLALDSADGTLWRFSAVVVPDTYLGFGFSAGVKSVPAVSTSYGSSDSGLLLQASGQIRAQLPIRWSSFTLIPYAGLSAGLAIDTQMNNDSGGGFFAAAEGGAQAGFGETPHFFVGSAYKQYLLGPSTCKGSAVSVWLGYSF